MAPCKKIHVVFKTHLDLGFTDLAGDVLDLYLDRFIPKAIEVGEQCQKEYGKSFFTWTTGSWLVHQYLEQVSARKRLRMEEAIASGIIVWHGLPFTTHSEMMDADLFRVGLGLSQELDRRFGRRTIAAKMTDVPGHTSAIVPLLREAGIEFLHVGVNPASTPPDVPEAFRWQYSGEDRTDWITVVYDRKAYGGLSRIQGAAEALFIAHTGDNRGPCKIEDVIGVFKNLKRKHAEAEVIPSNLNRFFRAIRPVVDGLPLIEKEIGDTWIHGIGSDPLKVAQFRAMRRWRCGIDKSRINPGTGAALLKFDRRLLLIPEHTWGLDVKLCLGFEKNYDKRFSVQSFAKARLEPQYKRLEKSWTEQRRYLDFAHDALKNTSLWPEVQAEREKCIPEKFIHSGKSYSGDVLHTPFFDVGFDQTTGCLNLLQERTSGYTWADAQHPIGKIGYEIYSAQDYEVLWKRYNRGYIKNRDWAIPDFLKPGIERVISDHQVWMPVVKRSTLSCADDDTKTTLLMDLAFSKESAWKCFGGAREFQLKVVISHLKPEILFTLQWFGKSATRLPEATWFSMIPRIQSGGVWHFQKLGSWVSPLNVIRNGNRSLHSVEGCRYCDDTRELLVENLDSSLVAPGSPRLVRYSNRLPSLSKGVHFNLHNNTWGTNFPLWYGDDGKASFRLVVTDLAKGKIGGGR